MNAYQRLKARKAGKACGYADGGGVRGGVSDAIERVGRFFGTEKAKKIEAADRDMRGSTTEKGQNVIQRAITGKRLDRAEDDALRDADTERGMSGVRD